MNERPAAYWHARVAAGGFALLWRDSALRADVAGRDLPCWYAVNMHLYEPHA